LRLYRANLKRSTVTFSWFASVYSSLLVLLTKIYHKRSIIVLGGGDVAKIPELNYGIWNSKWKSLFVGYGIRNADLILAVDESLKNDAIDLAHYSGKNIHVVPTGYEPNFWKPGIEKQNFVLTVANCWDMTRIAIKGIDFLLSIARKMPETRFVIVGIKSTLLRQLSIPSNVTVKEFLSHNELLELYQKAKVYLQPSMREGLPNTLCEAMLCNCFPVGTNIGGIPTAIGNTGLLIPYNHIPTAVEAIENGMQSEKVNLPRERIIAHFHIQQREEKLIKLISSLL
jgi:glycosyltransferase involved in cell wall biosynthesis